MTIPSEIQTNDTLSVSVFMGAIFGDSPPRIPPKTVAQHTAQIAVLWRPLEGKTMEVVFWDLWSDDTQLPDDVLAPYLQALRDMGYDVTLQPGDGHMRFTEVTPPEDPQDEA